MSQIPSVIEIEKPASPDAVYDALVADQVRNDASSNQRQHDRLSWVMDLTIWIREHKWESPREVQVKTSDLSRGGFCFLHSQFLYAKTLVYTRFDLLPGRPVVVGLVTNCSYVGEGHHRVGVRFLRSFHQDDQ